MQNKKIYIYIFLKSTRKEFIERDILPVFKQGK